MEKLKNAEITTLPLEITKAYWTTIENEKDGAKVTLDIRQFTQAIDNFRRQSLNLPPAKIKEIEVEIDNNEPACATISQNKIRCENASPGGFAHECYHLIAGNPDNPGISEELRLENQIINECNENNKKPSTVNYIELNTQNNYKKLIAYLYLAEEEEMISKLIGFYVERLFDEAAHGYMQEIVGLYDIMKEFNITKKELEQDQKQIIKEYIGRNKNLQLDFNTPETINAYLQKQSHTFIEKYKILFS